LTGGERLIDCLGRFPLAGQQVDLVREICQRFGRAHHGSADRGAIRKYAIAATAAGVGTLACLLRAEAKVTPGKVTSLWQTLIF
jgi:hypothetical protein